MRPRSRGQGGAKKRLEFENLNSTIHKIQTPNIKVMQKLDRAGDKQEMANKDLNTVRRRTKQDKQNFKKVKQVRNQIFEIFKLTFS